LYDLPPTCEPRVRFNFKFSSQNRFLSLVRGVSELLVGLFACLACLLLSLSLSSFSKFNNCLHLGRETPKIVRLGF
jgi:hypothetical protein